MIRATVASRRSDSLRRYRPAIHAATRFECEQLEVRLALAGFVFIDYGDNFPLAGANRTLNTTIQGLRDIANHPNPNDRILGTAIGDSAGFAPQITASVTFNAAARTITRGAGNFVNEGFRNNHQITITGTANNNGNFIIQNVAATVLTLTPAATLTNEGPVNATIGPRLDTPITVSRPGYTATERAQMLAVVQRAYRPLDLTVVELTPTAQNLADGRSVAAATSINDIINTLRGGNAAFRDAYVIAASFVVDPGGPNQNIYNSGGGNSPGSPTLGAASDLATGQNNHDDVALVFASGIGGNFTNTMNNISHEAGHLLGMRHSITDTGTNATTLQLHQAEIMSYQNTNNTSSSMFTRYPAIRGDNNTPVFNGQVVFNAAARTLTSNSGNFPVEFAAGQQIVVTSTVSNNNTYTVQTLAGNVITVTAGSPALTNETNNTTNIGLANPFNYNDLGPRNFPAGRPTYHDQLLNDANVRANQNLTFVSGTGQNDIITIARSGAQANITVQAFSTTNYAAGTAITVPGFPGSTSYQYSIPLTQPILVYGGDGNDRFVIDADLGVQTEVDGMLGTDQLWLNGKNAVSATYIPSGTSPAGVDLNIPAMTNVTSFEGLLSSGATSITFRNFETTSSVQVQDVSTLTFRSGGSDDNLSLSTPTAGQMRVGGTSDGVQLVPMDFFNVGALTLDTATNDGASPDDYVLLAANASAPGLNSIAVNTGAGADVLDVNFTPGNAIPTGGLSFDAGAAVSPGELLNLRGGSFTNETYTPSGPSSGTILLDATTITYSNLSPIADTTNAVNFMFNATAGADVINLIDGDIFNLFDTTQINSGNGTFELVNFANKTNVQVAGQNGADIFNVSLADPADGLTTLSLFGEDAANTGDDSAADRLNLTPQPGTLPIAVSGGGGNDVLAVDGSGGSLVVNNTTFTSGGIQTITYSTVERLEVSDGTFEVSGVVTTPFHVNTDGTLVGTGTASGGITVNAGGNVAPGLAGPGILGSGNLLFTGGTYSVDLNGTTPGTLHDQLNVTGTVDLGAGVATLNASIGYLSVPGDEIVIIRNDGADAVAGFFAGASQGAIFNFGGIKFTIDYAFEADGDGNFNDVALIRYGAALAPDPCDPTKQALFVSASAGGDVIELIGNHGNPRIQVIINGVDEGTFEPDGGIFAMAQNGDDLLTAAGIPSHEVVLYGNAGNDTLDGGNNDSILIGGWGDDLLQAGNAKDILIGGRGADELHAGHGTDIVIAGYTDYDVTTNAARAILCDIREAWHPGSKIAAVAGWLNAATMHDDAEVDRVFGENGKDWLVMNVLGGTALDVSDATGNDTVTDLA